MALTKKNQFRLSMTDDAYVVTICAGVLLAAAAAMGLCCGLIGCCVSRKIRGVIMGDSTKDFSISKTI